jgi:diaminopimelate epimerase
MRFSKWHGLGNDYLLVERAELAFPLTPERVQKALQAQRDRAM